MPEGRFLVATPPQPGAIAIIDVFDPPDSLVRTLTPRELDVGAMRLVDFAGVDTGLLARLTSTTWRLMPHGGPRVVQRLAGWLREQGLRATPATAIDPRVRYPEASDEVEACMLAALARDPSPLAIDLLLDQPRRWRAAEGSALTDKDRARSARLNRLLDPPLVVLAGPPNVGKSTLSNRLLGRDMAIATDVAGTTRDYIAATIDLGGLIVRWCDTPGLRATDDPVELKAIELAAGLMTQAAYLVAITDHAHDWPRLPREPDLRVGSKSDLGGRGDADISLSAATGDGVAALVERVREALVPASDHADGGRWIFDDGLA